MEGSAVLKRTLLCAALLTALSTAVPFLCLLFPSVPVQAAPHGYAVRRAYCGSTAGKHCRAFRCTHIPPNYHPA